MKTTKGGRVMNPTDSYRKEIRKKELKRNKKERKKVREVGILKKDPETLREQIQKLEAMKTEGALDKARKHKKRQLQDTLNLVLKKRKEYEEKMHEKGETPVMFSHLGPPRRRATAEEEERVKHPKPEDSVYYHPTLNPTGAPPPGKPPMFKSSIGPRIPLSEASTSGAASSSMSEADDMSLSVPPPPAPPLPHSGDSGSGDGSVMPESLPLPLPPPPPPPMPRKPAMADLGTSLPPPPLPPRPPAPPTKEQIGVYPPTSTPPALHSAHPPPPGTSGSEREKGQSVKLDDPNYMDSMQQTAILPPPPPPPGLPPKSASNQSEEAPSETDAKKLSEIKDPSKLVPPPPPPRLQAPLPGPSFAPHLQVDVLPPGISRAPPPPPPPDMRQPLTAPVIPGQPSPPGMMVPMIPRPSFGPPPGPPPMMWPPLPPIHQDDYVARQTVPQKPSYVKSAASTVVKRPLAQHTPELTAMVPASVRVRRESAVPKAKPKASSSTMPSATRPAVISAPAKQEPVISSSTAKPQSIDDSYMAFLEDMKVLGALDS